MQRLMNITEFKEVTSDFNKSVECHTTCLVSAVVVLALFDEVSLTERQERTVTHQSPRMNDCQSEGSLKPLSGQMIKNRWSRRIDESIKKNRSTEESTEESMRVTVGG